MRRARLLHDIGKLGTPPGILDKAGRLTPEELEIMRDHVRVGAHILEPIPRFAELLPIVRQHHEWVDDSAYPKGLAGEAIRLDACIFAVADCFDALASDRPYGRGLPREQVIEALKEETARHFDPRSSRPFFDS
jgi:HD-GYP domain-containing protein (c-di-GMP phosphodiesterase class II)